MVLNPITKRVEKDPVKFTKGKHTVSIQSYHSGFVAYLPHPGCGLCGGDLRGLGVALIEAATRVDYLNRLHEDGKMKSIDFPGEEIPVKSI
ncbi:MAG: hypothetical protein NTU58_01465 [Candidatus Nealsonbacteria bacterium]|nr:hypothetical protein [Candidatus Nealsonbacteria bacterium]